MRKRVAIITVVMLVLSLTCLAESRPVIAYVPKVVDMPWWDRVEQCVRDWGDENGIDIIYKGDNTTDVEPQVAIIRELVEQGIDILCFAPNDPAALEDICQQAREKGVIVISTEASGMRNVDYDIEAFDEKGLGAFLMDELAAQMGEEGEYITMVGSLTMESQNNWADAAIERQQQAYPLLTLLPERRVADDSNSQKAFELTLELKEKYPNLKGILGTGSFDVLGAAQAIEYLGLGGDMFAISVALPSEVKGYLANGTVQSVALWDPGITARAQLNAALKLYNGESITEGMDLGEEGYDEIHIEDKVIVGAGYLAVTLANCDSFGF